MKTIVKLSYLAMTASILLLLVMSHPLRRQRKKEGGKREMVIEKTI